MCGGVNKDIYLHMSRSSFSLQNYTTPFIVHNVSVPHLFPVLDDSESFPGFALERETQYGWETALLQSPSSTPPQSGKTTHTVPQECAIVHRRCTYTITLDRTNPRINTGSRSLAARIYTCRQGIHQLDARDIIDWIVAVDRKCGGDRGGR